MTRKSTKRALVMSALALLLCVSMLVGSTFAWFTDEVTSAGNIIKSGTLDVTMEWFDGTQAVPAVDSTDWIDASKGAIFNYDLWEPGYAEVRHIKIANVGTLALKYQLNIVANGEVSELADVIDVYYLDPAAQIADRAALTADKKIGTLSEVLAAVSTTASGNLLAGENVTITLALKMQEEAGNQYQNKSIGSDFAVQLLATQLTSENDSFDNQYDNESEFVSEVKTAEELAVALTAGGKVKLLNDIALDETVSVPAGVAVNLDLGGYKITSTETAITNNGTMTLVNGTVENTTVNGGATINNKGTLELEGVEIIGAPIAPDAGYPSYCVTNAGSLTVNDGTKIIADRGCLYLSGTGETVINGGTLTNNDISTKLNGRAFTSHVVVVGYGANNKLTINGGTFKHLHTSTSGGVVINNWSAVTVDVNGGSFSGGNYFGKWDNLSDYGYGSTKTPFAVKGGTFTGMDSKFVAAGYELVDNGNGTWTVGPYKVSGATELADALAAGKAVTLTQDVSIGKIDLTGANTNDVVIDANGHKITTTDVYGIEVAAGKNITVSNADVVMTKAGDYITYAAGFKIANGDYAGATITLKNCTITMANGDWAYAVNMPASVKNLNLVIDNCTLEGAVAVQCWGDNNTITITNSSLICNYTTSELYTSFCVSLQSDGSYVSENNTLVIDNCEFKYSGIDNFDSSIYSVKDYGNGNTVKVTNCTYDAKVV